MLAAQGAKQPIPKNQSGDDNSHQICGSFNHLQLTNLNKVGGILIPSSNEVPTTNSTDANQLLGYLRVRGSSWRCLHVGGGGSQDIFWWCVVHSRVH